MKDREMLRKLLDATEAFERVYLINRPLNPPDEAPVRDHMPGAWPEMGDLRRLLEVAEAARELTGRRRK